MPRQDPDEMLVVVFKTIAQENEAKTLQEGRPIYDDVEICEIRAPGSKDVKHFPSTCMSTGWLQDDMGKQYQISYAERFRHQYQQFKRDAIQTKSGTPLDHVPFLTEAKRAELRALNVYTLETLAGIEGNELKNLGINGRELKNQAVAYMEEALVNAPTLQLQAQLDALAARNAILEEDLLILKAKKQQESESFEDMTAEQLAEYITANTGHAPQGNLSRKTLLRLATDIKAGDLT